ncbi:MAG: hypothetical protein GY838_17760 [bacterium]|nr:hypothetical protein [bacterium]
MSRSGSLFRISAATGLILVALGVFVSEGAALVRFDFEQKYHVHPGRQTWDFSVVRDDTVYNLFYHGIPIATPHASAADTIWRATSPDLVHWDVAGPVVLSGTGAWDTSAVWAPDVFRDEAGDRWVMAYTGADARMNQRLGLAFSTNLAHWSAGPNPVLEPDSTVYAWAPSRSWADFRDPFVYRDGGQWHVLLTAAQWLGERTGILYHAVSDDLVSWSDVGPLFANDGSEPWRVLESPQYHLMGGHHQLLFGEYDTIGVSQVPAQDPDSLTMADRAFIDGGYAPEVDEFDPGVRILSRIVPLPLPTGGLIYVIRFDTLQVSPDGDALTVLRPHPLDADWERSGAATNANPTFGDNPLWRGDPGVNPVGNGYFGSGEYFQGPLSNYPSPGAYLGGWATGELLSRPFTVTGDRMTLLVGGAAKPESLYVALVDADTDQILLSETGSGTPILEPREWSLAGLRGRSCRIRIVDFATGADDVINVDEIVEIDDLGTSDVRRPVLLTHRAVPNPANPRTEIRCELPHPAAVALHIHDARGRVVWRGPVRTVAAGPMSLAWSGRDDAGREAASGVYFYRVLADGAPVALGKLALVR